MKAVLKNVYTDVLDDIIDKYNNTYHQSIKMKPIDVKSDSYAEYSIDSNAKDTKFKIGDRGRISRYNNIFSKVYAPNWSEKVFVVSKHKNTVRWTMLLVILMEKKLMERSMKKNCKRQIKHNLELKK